MHNVLYEVKVALRELHIECPCSTALPLPVFGFFRAKNIAALSSIL